MARPKQKADEPKINKSQAIREYLAANPGVKPKDIVTELAKKGVEVTTTLVYLIKSKENHRPKRKQAASSSSTSRRLPVSNDTVQTVLMVKELAGQVGGYEKLRELVDALAQ